MTRRTPPPLQVDARATSRPVNSNSANRLNSPSGDELFRELVVGAASSNKRTLASTFSNLTSTTTPAMADRFPSLEDFSPGHDETSGNGIIHTPNASGDDDFLARERTLLGDDAAQFASASERSTSATAVPEHDEEDLLGGDTYLGGQTAVEDVRRFESSFPKVDAHNERVAPGGTITGSDSLARSQPSYRIDDQGEEEPEPIRLWRQRRDEDIARRAEVSAKKKEETLAAAARWTDSFYTDYNKNKDKAIAKARREAEEYLNQREDTAAGGTAWERVAKLVDLNSKGGNAPGGDGKEKFRELLRDLKKDENAPGAKGY